MSNAMAGGAAQLERVLQTARLDDYPGSAGLVVFRRLIYVLLDGPQNQKVQAKATILKILGIAQEPDRYIDELLTLCSLHPSVNRLDVAIDVLSETKDLVRAYAWSYLCRDVREWNRLSDRAYEPNDDYWYILLRSVARTRADEAAKLLFIRSCSGAVTRGMKEGVVQALGDLGTPGAVNLLRDFAKSDPDSFIRQLAKDEIDELER